MVGGWDSMSEPGSPRTDTSLPSPPKGSGSAGPGSSPPSAIYQPSANEATGYLSALSLAFSSFKEGPVSQGCGAQQSVKPKSGSFECRTGRASGLSPTGDIQATPIIVLPASLLTEG